MPKSCADIGATRKDMSHFTTRKRRSVSWPDGIFNIPHIIIIMEEEMHKRLWFPVTLVVLVSLLLGACAPAPTPSAPAAAPTQAAAGAAPTQAAAATEAPAASQG